jgi:hypothetical protein
MFIGKGLVIKKGWQTVSLFWLFGFICAFILTPGLRGNKKGTHIKRGIVPCGC